MKRRQTVLCVTGILCVMVVKAAAASAALPEMLNNVGAEIKGAKEILTESKTASTLEDEAGEKVTCGGEKGDGEVSGLKRILSMTITLTKCTNPGRGVECQNQGVGTEKIVTNVLEGEIGYIEPKANKEVGFDIKPVVPNPVANFSCGNFGDEVRGSVIGKVEPVNVVQSKFKIKFQAGANKGEQKITKLEAQAEDVLVSSGCGGALKKTNFQAELGIEFAQEVEFKA